MSEFRKIVESILKEELPRSYDYWRTTDPSYENDNYDKYENWLENQDFKEGFAIFVKKDDKGKDLFAAADKSVPEDPEYYVTTDITGDDPELPDVFETPEQAQMFAKEWSQFHPEEKLEIVKVYSRYEDGYEFYKTKEEVYPYETWDYDDYR